MTATLAIPDKIREIERADIETPLFVARGEEVALGTEIEGIAPVLPVAFALSALAERAAKPTDGGLWRKTV